MAHAVSGDSASALLGAASHKEDEQLILSASESETKVIDHSAAKRALSTMEEEEPAQARMILKVYPRRWLVLLVVALLNNSNTMSWIAFAPIANHSATNWFSMIYMICTIPVGIVAMWAGRFLGLRWAILIAAWANGLGGLIRLGSTYLDPSLRFPVGITGQAISAIAYPFIMFLPTKVAAAWFPDNQRAIATTIGIMSNPLGVLLANLLSPMLCHSPEDVQYVNLMTAIPSVIACIIASVAITRSEPKHPPTISAGQKQMDFFAGVKSCFTNKEYLILLLVMGGGIGLFNCLYTVMQQLLCPYGYSNSFSGYCAALMIIGGVFGATGAGIFVDRTKKFQETLKVAMGVAVLFGVIFLQLVQHPGLKPFILGTCFLFGVMGLATYPVGLELSAECAFPVSETTSTGLIVLSGQVQSVIYVAIMSMLAKPLTGENAKYQTCKIAGDKEATEAKNYYMSNIVMSIIAAVLFFILVIFFYPKYRRMEAEKAHGIVPKNNQEAHAANAELEPLKA
uniref:Major facilitator superfamily (MFS) profile domain-containing protein n=1 Tax=Panagrolaimus sp. ES5 TaxID=591445 RepID=A0AC34F6K4_9BILA